MFQFDTASSCVRPIVHLLSADHLLLSSVRSPFLKESISTGLCFVSNKKYGKLVFPISTTAPLVQCGDHSSKQFPGTLLFPPPVLGKEVPLVPSSPLSRQGQKKKEGPKCCMCCCRILPWERGNHSRSTAGGGIVCFLYVYCS